MARTKNSCREIGILIHSSWECQIVQPLSGNSSSYETELLYDPAIQLLGMCSAEMETQEFGHKCF